MSDAAVPDTVLMTLAGIAYGAPQDLARYLNEATPTANDWSIAWLAEPPSPPVNFAFMAKSARTGASVIAIRGTYPDPFSQAYWDDGQQDSPFGTMADWLGTTGACISAGTAKGLQGLLALSDQQGQSIEAAVRALPPASSLTVTGHSLGGTLAPVLALQLSQSFPGLDIRSTSFAGMTPGNEAFAALFGGGTRWEGKARRVYNTLDTVSYGWNKVWATHDFYQPAPQGGPVVAALLLATMARLELGGYDFAPVGEPVALTGSVASTDIGCELVAYVFQNLHQHLPDTYLSLLGAPPLPFSILWGSLVVPRSHPAAAAGPNPRNAVAYLS